MSASLARYLKDFSEPEIVPLPLEDMPTASNWEEPVAAPPIAEPVDVEAECARAYNQGHEAASEELHRQFADERQMLAAAHAQEVAALRNQYEAEAAELIAARFREVASLVAQTVSDQTAQILAPLLDEAITAKAVSDMADLVQDAVMEGDVGTLKVCGPLHMFEQLRERLKTSGALLRHIEASDLDLAVDIGETALVTRMSAWSASLKKVLA